MMNEEEYKEFVEISKKVNESMVRWASMTPEERAQVNTRIEAHRTAVRKEERQKWEALVEAQQEETRRMQAGVEARWGYMPELEPYRKGLAEASFRHSVAHGDYVRGDCYAQDPSDGLKLVRIGAYRAGVEEWDGRGRHSKRDYDVEGDYFLEFDDGSRLECFHGPDCCEDNYADFPHMQIIGVQEGNSVDARDLTFFPDVLNSIIPIKDLGFYIVTVEGICILVSCYSKQNGYYSTDLKLVHRKRYVDLGEDCVRFKDDYDEWEDDE